METPHYNLGSMFAFYASFTAFLSLAKQFYHQFIPEQIRNYIDDKIKEWFSKQNILDPKIFTLVVKHEYYHEDRGYSQPNSVYNACEAYLSAKLRSESTRLEGFRREDESSVSYHLTQGEHFVEYVSLDETHKDVKLEWRFLTLNDKGEEEADGRHKLFELSFDPRYKDLVLDTFIPSVVVKRYDEMLEMRKDIYLYSYNSMSHRDWYPVSFKHPFTFDALALDPDLKKSIVEDLDRFVRRREFYKKIGRAWKRGYLLYGPPGTGKSSLIAAIANYLKFSVYDLQLASIEKDSTLRSMMMSINNKSILVIEDIDCASGLSRNVALSRIPEGYGSDSDYTNHDDDDNGNGDDNADNNGGAPEALVNLNDKIELSLSGLLNFIDGLWSSCGDERIIILTTNYKERLDPALLRPGRMDMHIHMSYLRMPGFRILASNYLNLSEHPLFEEIEELLEKTDVSPAQVAEELIRSEDTDIALNGVVKMLKQKQKKVRKKETNEAVDNSGKDPLAKKQKCGGESTSHTEITED